VRRGGGESNFHEEGRRLSEGREEGNSTETLLGKFIIAKRECKHRDSFEEKRGEKKSKLTGGRVLPAGKLPCRSRKRSLDAPEMK